MKLEILVCGGKRDDKIMGQVFLLFKTTECKAILSSGDLSLSSLLCTVSKSATKYHYVFTSEPKEKLHFHASKYWVVNETKCTDY